MLVEDKRGRWVRVDDIVELYAVKSEHGCRATMREGPPVEFYDTCPEIANALLPVVAAQPGFEALTFCGMGTEEDPYFVSRAPIIGWRCHATCVDPIALDEEGDVGVVKCPDGQVMELACAVYPNEEAWFNSAKETHQARKLVAVK